MTFPDQLRSQRKRLGLTQSEAAQLLEVSKSAYEKWETGVIDPLAVTKEGVLARLHKAKSR